MRVILILLSMSLSLLTQGRICPEIYVSSNISKVKDDMVKNGVTTPKWIESSTTPIIIGSSKQIDYIYVTLERHYDSNENVSFFKLNFDDHIYANSTLKFDVSHPNARETEYAVEVYYLCNDYGGSLVNYDLEISIPGCGEAKVFWKKLCGNPLIPRDGLTVDLESDKINETIVKNGKIVNPSYFDRDIDNFVFNVGETTNKTTFYVYMDNSTINTNETDPIVKALRDMIRLVPETKYSKLKVDADQSLVTPILEGSFIEGGYITTKKTPIVMEFKCLGRKGSSLVEFSIPLDYFKDVTLFFKKSCDGAADFVFPEHSEFWAVAMWLVVLLLMSCILAILYNMFVHKKNGYDSIPGMEKAIKLALGAKFIRESKFGTKLTEINQTHFHAIQGNNEPEESEFKIENISEIAAKEKNGKDQPPSKYGSI